MLGDTPNTTTDLILTQSPYPVTAAMLHVCIKHSVLAVTAAARLKWAALPHEVGKGGPWRCWYLPTNMLVSFFAKKDSWEGHRRQLFLNRNMIIQCQNGNCFLLDVSYIRLTCSRDPVASQHIL